MKASMPPLYPARPAASIRFLRAFDKLLSGLQALLLDLNGLVHSLSRQLLGFLRLLELLLPGRGAGRRGPHRFDAAARQRGEHDQHRDLRESHGLLLSRRARRSAEKGHLLFWTLVDDALCLADRALDRADLHVGADADVGLDVVLQPGGRLFVSLDHHGEVVEGAVFRYLEHVMGAQARLLEDQLLDLRREHVDTADDQHVVGATRDALHAAHRARSGRSEPREVARAVADHRQRFLGERGEHQLAFLAVGQWSATRRVDDFGIEVIFPDRKPVLGLDALLRHAGPHHLGQAVEIARFERQPGLDRAPHLAGPRLGAEDPDAQRARAWIDALALPLVGDGEHVARRHHDDVWLEVLDELDLSNGTAAAERNDGEAEALGAVMRSQASCEEAVAVG